MVHHALFARLDLPTAIERELSSRNRLLPPRWDYAALASDAASVARWLTPRLRKGNYGNLASVVFADKSQRGTRPLNILTLDDRILYRALVDLLAASLPERLQSRRPFGEFQQAPLDSPEVRYVIKSDVTAYYEYVDHDLLADELTAQTGDELAIEALVELLGALMGRRVGLPQVHKASDVLGDTYIDPVRRRLLRAGYSVFTYSDDFRIASSSLGSARAAIEACSAEVRKLGLVLNEHKTYTYGARKYRRSLNSFADAEQHLFIDADHDITDLSLLTEGYGDETQDDAQIAEAQALGLSDHPIDRSVEEEETIGNADGSELRDGAVSQERARAAGRAWEIWAEEDESEEVQSSQAAAITQSLLGRALPILGAAGNPDPLESIEALLRFEPALTPQISAYLAAYGSTGRAATAQIRTMLDEVAGKDIFSTWQGMWIAHAAGSLIGRPRQNRAHVQWLLKCAAESPDGLGATATAALGRLGVGDASAMAATLDRMGAEWRQLALWGLGRLDAAAAVTYAEHQLDRILLASAAHT